MRYLALILSICLFACNNKKEEVVDETIPIDSTSVPVISSKMLIIPGEKIGNISLGQNAGELESILGKPDVSDAAMGKAWITWFSKVSDTVTGNELNIYTTYKDNEMMEKVVRQIRITSNEFKTAEGLSTGKSLAEIQKIYPEIEQTGKYDMETNTPVTVYDDTESGIAFEFEDNTCVGIIIHEKEKKVSEEYLSFHPDMVPM
jgi:hypothetical protein